MVKEAFTLAEQENTPQEESLEQDQSTQTNEEKTKCPPGTFAYTVQKGDTFFTIAKKFGVSLDSLVDANPQIKDPSRIFPGQIVCVPENHTVCPPGTTSYTVQPGDTLFTIAKRFGVSLDALIEANPQIPDPNLIFPGQIICIPDQKTKCPPNTFEYTVRPGDSLFRIAQRFGISLNALIAANPQIPNPNKIFPGQIICVPKKKTPQPPQTCPPGTFRYTVQPGDSLFLIARRFGVSLNALIAANPQIPDPNRIVPGQVICVPNR